MKYFVHYEQPIDTGIYAPTGKLSLFPGGLNFVERYENIDHMARCTVEGSKPSDDRAPYECIEAGVDMLAMFASGGDEGGF